MNFKIQYILFLILASFVSHNAISQGCNVPLNLCESDGTVSFDTSNGTSTPASNDCFTATNSIFIAFNTLSEQYLTANGIGFIGNANIEISAITCDTSQTTSALSATIVSAGNPCIATTYDQLDCVPPTMDNNISIALTDLLPDTTYYLIINAADASDNPSLCSFEVSVSGSAVEYELDATANPPNIISGETSQLQSNAGFDSYEWSGTNLENTNTQNTSVTLDEEGEGYTYTLQAQIKGCEVTDQVLVQVVPALTIRNTITPNGDGRNDTWTIQGLHRFPDAEIRVYSRWGQMVFRTRNYSPWDGGGLPEAVYYYVIDLNPLGFDTPPYTGYLTIIR